MNGPFADAFRGAARRLWLPARVLCLFAAMHLSATAQESNITVNLQEQWSAVWGGKEARFHAVVTSREAFQGRLGWSLSAKERVIQRQESAVTAEPNRSATVELILRIPDVKEGVIFPAQLSLALYGTDGNAATGTLTKTLWAYAEDPFFGATDRLRKLRIALFDPERKTAETLEKAKFPFSLVQNVAALADADCGLLVIGERVSFRDYRGLWEAMVNVAARGIPVLCLAPSAGEISIPGTEGAVDPRPLSIRLERESIITALDKRLDAVAWPPDGKLVQSRVVLKGERGPVIGEVKTDDPSGWPWMEVRFAGEKGRVVICGFPIIAKWDTGPTPRFLFVRIMEELAPGLKASSGK